MGNCLKPKNASLNEPLNNFFFENENDINDMNELYNKIDELTIKFNLLEKKMTILENNTQKNLKLLSTDIYHLNNHLNSQLID